MSSEPTVTAEVSYCVDSATDVCHATDPSATAAIGDGYGVGEGGGAVGGAILPNVTAAPPSERRPGASDARAPSFSGALLREHAASITRSMTSAKRLLTVAKRASKRNRDAA